MTRQRPHDTPRTVVWRHLYRGRLRWAIPNLLIEETPERVVALEGLGRAGRSRASRHLHPRTGWRDPRRGPARDRQPRHALADRLGIVAAGPRVAAAGTPRRLGPLL